jgi:hypothetical protein
VLIDGEGDRDPDEGRHRMRERSAQRVELAFQVGVGLIERFAEGGEGHR